MRGHTARDGLSYVTTVDDSHDARRATAHDAGAGHLVLPDEPTRVAPVIVDFLEFGIPPRTADTDYPVSPDC
jgi:hypothetical protein